MVRLIKKLEIQSLNDKLDRVTNDPGYQKILKRYNLKPIDYTKNYDLSDLSHFREKREEEEKEREKQREKKSQIRLKQLTEKHGSKTGYFIHKGKVDLGMTKKMVIESKGKPDHKIEKVSRGKKREEYFYDGYKNRQGNMSYKFRVVLIDGKVDGWNDITN